jgi:outer membrane biosynthesis protein TonB
MKMSTCTCEPQHSPTLLPSQLLLATVLLSMSHTKPAHRVAIHTAQRQALATVCTQQPSKDQTLAPWQPPPSPPAALPIQAQALQIMAPQQLRLAAQIRSAQQPRELDMTRLREKLMTEQACRSLQTSYRLDQLLASTPGMLFCATFLMRGCDF